MKVNSPTQILIQLLLLLICSISLPVLSQENPDISGRWIFNEKQSDVTDKRVEVALKAGGEKVKRQWFKKTKDRYKGGPVEQELYDHISYDHSLVIELSPPEFTFTYDDNFVRPVYTDNRGRSISLNRLEDIEDFSFAHWSDGKLLVEARPRDGGFANETYTLINDGSQLRVELYIKPRSFQVPIEIVRVYDRKQAP